MDQNENTLPSLIKAYFLAVNPSERKNLKADIIQGFSQVGTEGRSLNEILCSKAFELLKEGCCSRLIFEFIRNSGCDPDCLAEIFENEQIPALFRFRLLKPLTVKLGTRVLEKIKRYVYSTIPLPEEIFMEILESLAFLPISSSVEIYRHLYENSIYLKVKLFSLIRLNEFDFLRYKNTLFTVVVNGLTSDKILLIDILDSIRPSFAPLVLNKLSISQEPSVQVKAELLLEVLESSPCFRVAEPGFIHSTNNDQIIKIMMDANSSFEEKTFAVNRIKELDNNVHYLSGLLKHEKDPFILSNALKAINGLSAEKLLEYDLFCVMESDEERVRANFIEMLTDNSIFDSEISRKVFSYKNDDSIRVKMALLYYTWHYNRSEFHDITTEMIRLNDFFVIDAILSIIEKIFFLAHEDSFDELILRILDIKNPAIHKKALLLYKKLKKNHSGPQDSPLISSEEITKLLQKNTGEADSFRKSSFLSSIKNLAGQEHLSLLNTFLLDEDERVRANALETILCVCGVNKSDIIREIESDNSMRVRLLSLTVSLKEDFENKFYEIQEFLQSGEPRLIKAAIFVLAHFPEVPAARNILKNFINSENIELASFASYFIAHPVLTTSESENRWQNFQFAQDLFTRGTKSEIDLAQRYFRSLVNLKDFELLDQLFFSESCNKFTKSYILKLIAENGDKESFEFARKYLKDYDPRVRANIVEGLMTHESAITDSIIYELLEFETDPRVLNNILLYIYPKNEKLVIKKLETMKQTMNEEEFKKFDFIIDSLGIKL